MNKGDIPFKEASGESVLAYNLAFVAIIIVVLLAISLLALFFVPVLAWPFSFFSGKAPMENSFPSGCQEISGSLFPSGNK
jgi:hypothetical protein